MVADTITIRFRWWVAPLEWLLKVPLILLGLLTPRRWHPVILNKLGGWIAQHGAVAEVTR